MSEDEFWRSTPRKIWSLLVFEDIKDGKIETRQSIEDKNKKGFEALAKLAGG